MAKINLTAEQQAVVENRGGNLLVSAAAGSGKTRVLVERLFRYVMEEHCHIDDFLIITYTRAAAAELRCRIAEELSERLAAAPEDRHLQQQLYRIYRADIKTVDSFCTALLRENVHLLEEVEGRSLTADFRVLEENEAELLRRRVMREVLERFYERLDEGNELLADTLGFGRDDRSLEELVLTLYNKLQSHAYPERWMKQAAAFWQVLPKTVDDTPYATLLLEAVGRRARHWAKVLRQAAMDMEENEAVRKGYAAPFLSVAGQLDALDRETKQGWEAVRAASITFPRLGAVKNDAGGDLKLRMKTLWELCKKTWKEQAALFSVSDQEAMEDLAAVAPAMTALLRLTEDFGKAYQMEKLRRNVTDFSDQEHFAVALLLGEDGEPTELCQRVAGRYAEIMVDEYQDTNEVQNCIFEALSAERRNLFTVGDVKQSIYRFRLADPGIFLGKYKSFTYFDKAEKGEDRKILLSKNFRSRAEVLSAANFVFENVLSEEMGEMDYGEEERLYGGADYYPLHEHCAVEFHLLDVEWGGERFAAARPLIEARFVAEKLAAMLEEGYLVHDGGVLRPCRTGDFAILMRSPGPRLRLYAQAFQERGIPCATAEDEEFFAQMEVAVTFSLIQIIDNPRQDVPLISVLRSPVFGFTPDRLAQIRVKHRTGDFYDALLADSGEDSKAFVARLAGLRRKAKDLSVHNLLWYLYDSLYLFGVFGAMAGGELRRENLVTLYEYAKGFELTGYRGLFAFVTHLRQLLERGGQPAATTGSAGESVQVMSIHKSKGLEFPIVILADLAKDFNQMDYRTSVLVHPQHGLGPLRVDLDRRIRYPTLAREAVESALRREGKSEELRVLYVAMTRAKEKLIMVASMLGAEKRLEKLVAQAACPVPPNTVAEAKSMAEWILLPLLCRMEAKPLWELCGMEPGQVVLREELPWKIAVHRGEAYLRPYEKPEVSEEAGETQTEKTLPFDADLLSFCYPHAAAAALPTKLTATQLKGRMKDEEVSEGTTRHAAYAAFARPAFLDTGLTAAQKGTAMHAVMEHLDFHCTDVDAAIAALRADGRLSDEEARAVDRKALTAFLASPLAEELRGAKTLWREYRFSLLVDGAAYLGKEAQGEEVMLQGVVDCFYETDEGLVVVDFKTDHVSGEALKERTERYRAQVEAYSAALEKIFEKKVCRRLLYYFHTGETVEL